MKKLIKLFIITALLQAFPSYGMLMGVLTEQTTTTDMISLSSLNYAFDTQTYTTGGITFTYPTGFFNFPPFVQIAVQPTNSHPTTETFGAEINTNSAGSTTIMVYLVNAGVVSEAPDASVTVFLIAIANPS